MINIHLLILMMTSTASTIETKEVKHQKITFKTRMQANKELTSKITERKNGDKTKFIFVKYVRFLKCVILKKFGNLISDIIKNPDENKDGLSMSVHIKRLSIIVRKLKFPFLTGVEEIDSGTISNAEHKLKMVLENIPPEIMVKLTELETPFPFESELSPEPVVSAPELCEVREDTIRLELDELKPNILSALYAILTRTGITQVQTICDVFNRYKDSFKELEDRIQQMLRGEILANQKTHRDVQHCRNKNGCPNCRALCALLTIFRFGSNPEIEKQVCRCVWHGSMFAEQVMCKFIVLTLGPTCALAQVVNNPKSHHREMLVQILTDLNVQETPEQKDLREKEDVIDKKMELTEFKRHVRVEDKIDAAFQRTDAFLYGFGYSI